MLNSIDATGTNSARFILIMTHLTVCIALMILLSEQTCIFIVSKSTLSILVLKPSYSWRNFFLLWILFIRISLCSNTYIVVLYAAYCYVKPLYVESRFACVTHDTFQELCIQFALCCALLWFGFRLTHCDLVTPNGDINLCQPWLRQWLLA